MDTDPDAPIAGYSSLHPNQRTETEHKSGEQINHPAHYGGEDNPYEVIKVIEAWNLNFHLGNAIKYMYRADKKGNELEDLLKAKWYLEREINNVKYGTNRR